MAEAYGYQLAEEAEVAFKEDQREKGRDLALLSIAFSLDRIGDILSRVEDQGLPNRRH